MSNANMIILHDAGVVYVVTDRQNSGYHELIDRGVLYSASGYLLSQFLRCYGVKPKSAAGRNVDDIDIELLQRLQVIGASGYPESWGVVNRLDVWADEPGKIIFTVHYAEECDMETETVTYSGPYSVFWAKKE